MSIIRCMRAVLVLSILFTTAVEARLFHGPYAGLHLFYHMNRLKAFQPQNNQIPDKFSVDSWSLGMHGGYGRTFDNRLFAGFDAYLDYDNISKFNKDYTITQNGLAVEGRVKIRRMFTFGMDLRPGYNLEKFVPHGALVYTGVTFVMSRFNVGGTLTDIGATGKSKSLFIYGVGPVVGGEVRLQKNLAIGGNYKFHVYGKKRFNKLTLRPKVNSFELYLSYYF